MTLISEAREVLTREAKAIRKLAGRLDREFERVVKAILKCQGKVIVTGMGKSGLVGRKIAASLASTGTPSFFVHPAEALHGDLGMITNKDIVIAISNSGETEEVIKSLPIIKKIGAKVVAFVGRADSTLAKESDFVLSIGEEKEADPFNLVPTVTAVVTLALGDALTIALLKKRDFKQRDFAFLHPGGRAGRMLMIVRDLMHSQEENPTILQNKFVKDALFIITSKHLGAVSVIDKQGEIVGIVTDGDVRRLLEKTQDFLAKLFLTEVKEVMTKSPKCITAEDLASEAVKKMEDNAITVLPVVNKKKQPIAMIHLHDLVKAGFALERKRHLLHPRI